MPQPVYEALADALTLRGNAVSIIKCPEFYALLENLFTPEEAELAVKLPLDAFTLQELASQVEIDPKEVERILEGMADKGLLVSLERGGIRTYRMMAVLPGFFEFQFMRGE